MSLALVILACFIVHTVLQERVKRKVSYTVHVQERTEEAETLDFAVHLFEDETAGKWQEKLNVAFDVAEGRRKFNNERILKMQEDAKERWAKEQEAQGKVVAMKKV